MSTIPSYPVATTPLGGANQFYLEQGSDADRGKRATIQMVMDKALAAAEAQYQAYFQEKVLDLSPTDIMLPSYGSGGISVNLGSAIVLANSFIRIRPIGASIGGMSYMQRTFEISGRLHFQSGSARNSTPFQITIPKAHLGSVPWRAAFEAALLVPVSPRLGGQIGGAWFPNASPSPVWTWGLAWTDTEASPTFTILLGTSYTGGLGSSAAAGCNFQLQVEA